jgi:3-hydroxyisobutyrate dehydrogenase
MMLKDLKLAQDAAQSAAARTPLGAAAAMVYAQYVEGGEGARDFSGIIRHLRAT